MAKDLFDQNGISQSLHEIIGDRFSKYAKYVIQERAIPDIRDGLKPVQRRILYAMFSLGLLHSKPFKKSARIVGEVIGKYHPHGDTSVYDALVRMSQEWKVNYPLIDMHGNKGSIDDDPPAAMRYTETRLTEMSELLLKDLHKETVSFTLNFDDTEEEPTVLTSYFPNLLVNGTTGIAAGYSTNIPPHNLSEIIDALVKRIDSPNCRLDTILQCVKGPDFPTGGIIQGITGIHESYETGKGRFIVRSKISVEKSSTRFFLVVTEIPFEISKAALIKQIDEIIINDQLPGLVEVRDETDREGLRIVIEVKKDANLEVIQNFLFKKTSLQIYYNSQMVAIANKKPILFNILDYLDYVINHQIDILLKKSEKELKESKLRLEVIKGLIKAINNLDLTIQIIRKSTNKEEAINNLMKHAKLEFTKNQADAIVQLRLYRLTSTDITELQNEHETLTALVKQLEETINSRDKQNDVIKLNLKSIKKTFGRDRRSVIEDQVSEIVINEADIVKEEDVFVSITHDGYIKSVNKKSFSASEFNTFGIKDGDVLVKNIEANTKENTYVFTNLGSFCSFPIYKVKQGRWKDIGTHLNDILSVSSDNKIINIMTFKKPDDRLLIASVSSDGKIKTTPLKEFEETKIRKPSKCLSLNEGEKMVSSFMVSKTDTVIIVTEKGWVGKYNIATVPVVGIKSMGVKAIKLKDDDRIAAAFRVKPEDVFAFITDRGHMKRIYVNGIEESSRTNVGTLALRDVKSKPHKVINAFVCDARNNISVLLEDNKVEFHTASDAPIGDPENGLTKICNEGVKTVFVDNYETDDQILATMSAFVENSSVVVEEKLKDFDERVDEAQKKIDKILGKQLNIFEDDEKKK